MHKIDDYLRALHVEAQLYSQCAIDTIYFGGGTPSLLSESQWCQLMNIVRTRFDVLPNAEWTMESNPEGVTAARAAVFRKSGINRISLGVQSFQDAYLKFLGRAHDQMTARCAYRHLKEAGFENINVDLMYGFPGQTREELQADLNAVAELGPQHVSIYTLTIDPRSRFFARQLKLDDDEKLAEDYVTVTEFLESVGLPQYEVSNFARPPFESRHNCRYWLGGDYIGLGMGAHSLDGARRYWNVDQLADYLEKIASHGMAQDGQEELTPLVRLKERLIFGLRMNQGIRIAELEHQSALAIPEADRRLLQEFVQEGFLTQEGGSLKTTLKGRLVLDELSARLI